MDLYLNIKCNIFVNLIEAACQNTIEMNTSAFHILLTAVELLIIEPLLAANESVVRGRQKANTWSQKEVVLWVFCFNNSSSIRGRAIPPLVQTSCQSIQRTKITNTTKINCRTTSALNAKLQCLCAYHCKCIVTTVC